MTIKTQRCISALWIGMFVFGLSGRAVAQQAPAEKPICKPTEIENEGKCVPKKPVPVRPSTPTTATTAEAPIEDPGDDTDGSIDLPRCNEHQNLIKGKCVKKN